MLPVHCMEYMGYLTCPKGPEGRVFGVFKGKVFYLRLDAVYGVSDLPPGQDLRPAPRAGCLTSPGGRTLTCPQGRMSHLPYWQVTDLP